MSYLSQSGSKNKCKIQKLQRCVQGIVVPHLRAVVFARLPVVITEVEGVGGFDDLLFAQAGAEVGIHRIEGYIFVPCVDIGVKLHVLGQFIHFYARPMCAASGWRSLFIIHAAIDKRIYIVFGHFLGIVPTVEHGVLAAQYVPVELGSVCSSARRSSERVSIAAHIFFSVAMPLARACSIICL